MKPTRTCNWPPRLDLILPPDLHGHARPMRERRATRLLHPALVVVARARWGGRKGGQRRFDAPARPAQATPVR
jgi:hypothetical protein